MDTEDGRGQPQLTDDVLDELRHTSFQHAMTLLGRVLPVDELIGRTPDPADEPVRFRANPELAFGPGDIHAARRSGTDPNLIEIDVNFIGLHGPSSPLPPHYSERIAQNQEGPETIRHFFDFFNHRIVSILRRIWLRWRYHLRYRPGGDDPISRRLLSLAGLPLDQGGGIAEERAMLLPDLGLLCLPARSATVVATILTNYFRLPVTLAEFVPREVEIPVEERSRLGGVHAQLGRNLVAGRMVADSLGKFRVRVGPLSRQQFDSFLPSGARHDRLTRLVDLVQGAPLEWDVELSLLPGEARPARLGRSKLGYTSWLSGVPEEVDPVVIAPEHQSRLGQAGG